MGPALRAVAVPTVVAPQVLEAPVPPVAEAVKVLAVVLTVATIKVPLKLAPVN